MKINYLLAASLIGSLVLPHAEAAVSTFVGSAEATLVDLQKN